MRYRSPMSCLPPSPVTLPGRGREEHHVAGRRFPAAGVWPIGHDRRRAGTGRARPRHTRAGGPRPRAPSERYAVSSWAPCGIPPAQGAVAVHPGRGPPRQARGAGPAPAEKAGMAASDLPRASPRTARRCGCAAAPFRTVGRTAAGRGSPGRRSVRYESGDAEEPRRRRPCAASCGRRHDGLRVVAGEEPVDRGSRPPVTRGHRGDRVRPPAAPPDRHPRLLRRPRRISRCAPP
jgi:hypothetical protein